MYQIINQLLSDKKGGITFSCFGIWHVCYIILFSIIILTAVLILQKKCQNTRQKSLGGFINVAFVLYILDFFLMPFAYQEIDIEKLPFHICTAMCVMCFLSRHNSFFGKYRLHFAMLGFISNLIYLIYPAGVMWYQVHPLSYRVVQTLLFHGIMTVYGILTIIFDNEKLEWKKCWKDFVLLIFMTLWAVLGNTLYNGEAGKYSHNFNWFFVVQDPFYILPEQIAPFVMPFLNIIAFFVVDILVYTVYFGIKKLYTLIK